MAGLTAAAAVAGLTETGATCFGVGAAGCFCDTRLWRTIRCDGRLLVVEEDEDRVVAVLATTPVAATPVAATPVAATAVVGDAVVVGCFFELVTARIGLLTTATTSPAAILRAGATLAERAGDPPPGRISSDRAIDATASPAGIALVTGRCSFILGTPTAATQRRFDLQEP